MKRSAGKVSGSYTLLLVSSILILVTVYLTLLRVDKFLKYNAINECANISKFEIVNENDGTKINYPLLDIYESCLKTKGINK